MFNYLFGQKAPAPKPTTYVWICVIDDKKGRMRPYGDVLVSTTKQKLLHQVSEWIQKYESLTVEREEILSSLNKVEFGEWDDFGDCRFNYHIYRRALE